MSQFENYKTSQRFILQGHEYLLLDLILESLKPHASEKNMRNFVEIWYVSLDDRKDRGWFLQSCQLCTAFGAAGKR